jgi:spermidine/putrescine transport system permease protein
LDSWKNNRPLFAILSAPAAFWLVVFFLVPLAFVWLISFGEKRGLVEIDLTWTFANYLRALDPLYLNILWRSVWVAGLATLICLVVGFPVALAITFAAPRWKPILLLLVILPFWTNLLVRTYALIAVLRTRGFANFGLEWLWEKASALIALVGLDPVPLLGERFQSLDLLYNHGAVVFGLVYVHLPFMILPLYAALERLDKSYLEASLDLGAGQWRTLFAVTVPLTLPGIVSGVIITFIPAMGSFLTPDLLGGPDSQMIGNLIERQFKAANDWPFGAALSFLLMYVTFFILAFRSVGAGRRARRLAED